LNRLRLGYMWKGGPLDPRLPEDGRDGLRRADDPEQCREDRV